MTTGRLTERSVEQDFSAQFSEGGQRQLLFHDGIAGLGGAVHGGALAAFALLASRDLASTDQGYVLSALSFHITYVRAARGKLIGAVPAFHRSVKELHFAGVTLEDGQGNALAQTQTILSSKKPISHAADPWTSPAGDGRAFETASNKIPFLKDRGLQVHGAEAGVLAVSLSPEETRNLDHDGAVHEGALLTLCDAAGSAVPFTLGLAIPMGATLSLSAHFFGRRPRSTVHARARLRDHANCYFWTDVELVDCFQERCGRASVLYRGAFTGLTEGSARQNIKMS